MSQWGGIVKIYRKTWGRLSASLDDTPFFFRVPWILKEFPVRRLFVVDVGVRNAK